MRRGAPSYTWIRGATSSAGRGFRAARTGRAHVTVYDSVRAARGWAGVARRCVVLGAEVGRRGYEVHIWGPVKH